MWKFCLFALAAVLMFPSAAMSCSVPVYRYAFELWAPDEFEVVLFHHGELKGDHAALRKLLEPKKTETAPVPNVRVHAVDLETNEIPQWQKLWEERGPKDSKEPWLFVFYPAAAAHGMQGGKPVTIWQGPFTKASLDLVFTSPARQELAKRIQGGDNGVWVILQSGDAKTDDGLARRLGGYLEKLEQTLELPELKEQDVAAGLISIDAEDLSIQFSVLNVAHDDPKEEVFRAMLLASEPDLRDLVGPLVFPVFGRGRSLYAMTDKGVTMENVKEDAVFLTGPCSCQVKRQNPGFDILTSADWDKLKEDQLKQLAESKRMKVSVDTPNPDGDSTEDEKPKEPSATDSAQPEETPKAGLGMVPLFGGIALLVLLVGGGIFLAGKGE